MLMSKKSRKTLKLRSLKYESLINENEKILLPDYKPRNIKLRKGEKLKNFQKIAVELFWRMGRFLDADVVGLGKTPTAIGCLTNKKYLPALVVVQSHLPEQWEEQFKKFINLKIHYIKTGKQYSLPLADVYIIKYTTVSKWLDILLIMNFKTLILDEVQEVRRVESMKHESCYTLSQNIPYLMALSGSPIYNYGIETWNIYKIIKPELFPDVETFKREWCSHKGRVIDPKALGTYLQESYSFIRRTKEDVKSEIPPLNTIVHTVGFDKKALDKMEKEAEILAIQILQGKFIERGQAARKLSIMIRKATGISKAASVADYVKILLENDEPVLLAGWHREVYRIWNEKLKDYNPVMYTGSESPKKKREAKNKFINGETNLMMISLGSCAGLDGLQGRCAYVVAGELAWSGAVHDQLFGRAYRMGQKRQVTGIYCVSNSGSDPLIIDILGIKRSQSEGIFNPTCSGKQLKISDDSTIKIFAKRFLEARKIK